MYVRGFSTVHPLNRLRDEMEQLFQGAFDGGAARGFPPLNMWEDEQNLYVEAELPGMSMKDLEVLVSGDELSIKGERPGKGDEKVAFHRRERGTGTFARTVRMPFDIDANKVQACLRDGVLLVTLPKAEAIKPRKIDVQSK